MLISKKEVKLISKFLGSTINAVVDHEGITFYTKNGFDTLTIKGEFNNLVHGNYDVNMQKLVLASETSLKNEVSISDCNCLNYINNNTYSFKDTEKYTPCAIPELKTLKAFAKYINKAFKFGDYVPSLILNSGAWHIFSPQHVIYGDNPNLLDIDEPIKIIDDKINKKINNFVDIIAFDKSGEFAYSVKHDMVCFKYETAKYVYKVVYDDIVSSRLDVSEIISQSSVHNSTTLEGDLTGVIRVLNEMTKICKKIGSTACYISKNVIKILNNNQIEEGFNLHGNGEYWLNITFIAGITEFINSLKFKNPLYLVGDNYEELAPVNYTLDVNGYQLKGVVTQYNIPN